MAPNVPPTRPPTATELLADPTVQRALEDAWTDSWANDPVQRHEEGGWIYMDTTTAQIGIVRAPSGGGDTIDLGEPPLFPGSVVVGTFHTHPNPSGENWKSGPSEDDDYWATISGVPWLIRAEDGIYSTGLGSRHGGLSGAPGYPF